MPLPQKIQEEIKRYCNNHLPNNDWYEKEFDFIHDVSLKNRIIREFKSIRYAYKLYEGITAEEEHLIFEIRSQILAYASIYEAVVEYVLETYYSDTQVYDDLVHQNNVMTKIYIPEEKRKKLERELIHLVDNGTKNIEIHTFFYQRKRKASTSIRFDAKCRAAEELNIISKIYQKGNKVVADLPSDIIEIYEYRNAIHLIAEQRKNIDYELELSQRAYRRMKPFIEQIKDRLITDNKLIIKNTKDTLTDSSIKN
ncbi:hypothetical protein ACLMA8_07835 [Streptococcus suis]|uniref:hypothetical protein n=1 Tax=Streptococcus suis TaxID=1307 RepID=UPI003A4D59A3